MNPASSLNRGVSEYLDQELGRLVSPLQYGGITSWHPDRKLQTLCSRGQIL